MSTNTANTANTSAATGATKKRFLPAELGLDAKGKPHAFHVEGYVGNPPFFRPEDGDKKAYLGFSIGIGQEADRMYALATGTYDPAKEYGGGSFIRVKAFGKIAEEFSKTCVKGLRVAVSGTVDKETFKKKDGSDGEGVVIMANNIVVMGSKSVEAIMSDHISVATRVYAGKDGIEHSQPMAEGLCATIKNNWGLKQSDSGMPYLSLAVKACVPAEKVYDLVTGKYSADKEYANKFLMHATLFGKQAQALANILRPDSEVVMTGPVSLREYNGETTYQIVPRVISIMKFAPQEGGATGAAPASAPAGSAAAAMEAPAESAGFTTYEDDDGELPF